MKTMKKQPVKATPKPDRNDPETWHIAIGKPTYEAIKEMVDALTKESAAAAYVSGLDMEACNKMLRDNDVEISDPKDPDEVRDTLTENIEDGTIEPKDFEFDEETAREAIQEDPLSVEVRSGWYAPGSEDNKPEEYCILLGTGGPATRIVGDLNNGQPMSARLEVQDWFKPWTEYFDVDHEILTTYAQQFYFGD